MSEEELVERCRNGERDAQHELYARTVPRIHRLLLAMTRNEEDALDLTQETYVRAFTRIGQFDGRSSLETWLYRIAVNQALGFLRRAKRERSSAERFSAAQTRRDCPRDGADSGLDLKAALSTLSASDRIILLLRYAQGLDYHAIARVIDCPEGTVASRLNRARQRLRLAMGDAYAGPEETRSGRHPMRGTTAAAEPWSPGEAASSQRVQEP